MKRIIALLAAACMIIMFAGCQNDGKKATADEASTEQTTEAEKVTKVSTPYADLCVPESFDKNVTNKVSKKDPYTLTFSSKKDNTVLFDIIFNGKGDALMGTIVGEKENTIVYMNVPKLNKKSDGYEDNLGYQQGVNTIVKYLEKDYDFRVDEAIEKQDSETFDVKTKVVTLKYPKKWEKKVKVTEKEDTVSFKAGDTRLFDLRFSKGDGNLLGTYKDTPIYVVEYKVKTDEQKAMQQDVNVIINNLSKDKDFKIN